MDEEKKRFESHLKKHLIHINKNLFISPADPLYYEKIIQYADPSCPESHFKLGQKCEQAGNWPKALYHYEKSLSRFSLYYHEAKQALERVKSSMNLPAPALDERNRSKQPWLQRSFITTLILFNLILIYLFFLFLTPTPLDAGTNAQSQTHGPSLNKPPPSALTSVGSNMVRTALQAYQKQYGHFPEELQDLVQEFPNNYLSFIPLEPLSGTNRIMSEFDGKGGWVYQPDLIEINQVFYPNLPLEEQIPFEPIHLTVWTDNHLLQIRSGPYLLAEKTVGLGKNDITPLGHFAVYERVRHPQGKLPNAYGNAALGLGEIAIHGTLDESSIGRNESLGCIRLTNQDIDSIYSFVPKGSIVKIQSGDDEDIAVSRTRDHAKTNAMSDAKINATSNIISDAKINATCNIISDAKNHVASTARSNTTIDIPAVQATSTNALTGDKLQLVPIHELIPDDLPPIQETAPERIFDWLG